MNYVRVTLSADGREAAIHPMYGVLTHAEFVDRATAIQWNFTGENLVIFHHIEGDIDAFETVVTNVDAVREYELEPTGGRSFYAYIHDETTSELREMFDPLSNGGVVVVPPIIYHPDGTVSLSAFGPSAGIQRLFEEVHSPVEVAIQDVGSLSAVPALAQTRLTDRQREAIVAALKLGYYEVPRAASHEDVADAIDGAPSTTANLLRRGEAKLLRAAVRG